MSFGWWGSRVTFWQDRVGSRQSRAAAQPPPEQRSNGATKQRSNGATEQRSNVATKQRSNEATEQRGNGAKIQRGRAHLELQRLGRWSYGGCFTETTASDFSSDNLTLATARLLTAAVELWRNLSGKVTHCKKNTSKGFINYFNSFVVREGVKNPNSCGHVRERGRGWTPCLQLNRCFF